MPQDGDNKMRTVNLFDEGYAGNVEIRDFIFNTDELDNGDNVNVCVYALDNGNVFTCDNEVVKHNIAKISLQIPGVPEQSSNGPTQYEDEDEDERESYVQQGDDSINTDKDQGSGIGVSFGDNSDHNTVNVDQRSTFADVIRDIVPIAKEGAHVAKDTAAQLLN